MRFNLALALYHQMGFKAPFVFCIIMAAIDFVMRLLIVERRNNPKEWFDDVDKHDPLTKTEQSVCDSGSPALTDDATATPLTANKVSIIKLLSYGRMWGALLITFIMAVVIGSIEVRICYFFFCSCYCDYNRILIGNTLFYSLPSR